MLPHLTLCATTRLAQTLRSVSPDGKDTWPSPPALTLGQWLASLADEALLTGIADLPTALDPFAERLLWEKAIAATLTEAAPLFDLPGMAASAAEAHALCRIWRLSPAGEMLSDEARLFLGWQANFEKSCREHGWIDTAGLHLRLLELLEAGHFALPERIAFAGFDRLTPLENRLQAVLAGRGTDVENTKNDAPRHAPEGSHRQVLPCTDSDAECAAVVAWAKARLAARPDSRLGIVAPDLAGVRDRLEFLLDDALHPALIRPDGAEAPRCFNFSLGRGLAEQPLIRIGLDLLALGNGRGKLEQQRLSALLLADGWSASETEADGRARLDVAMRRTLPYFTTLPALIRLAERTGAPCPKSCAALAACIETMSTQPKTQLPGAWAATFRRALHAVGWPGERALSSHEFQARQAFGEVLDSLGRLDALLGPQSLNEAIRRLRELCRQRLFQPETRGRPAIQVLGMLESAGLDFDALWIMGMNDDLWPPAPRPNPLLPAALLRAAGAAHASAEVELDFAQRVQARLSLAAPEIMFSWARADGNRILRPSPLIAGLPAAVDLPPGIETLARQMARQAGTETLLDALAPPVGTGEKVAGGSWLLRAQAICPAWAYFQYRLGAEAMEEPVEGLDPAARGTLVHAALEALWTGLRSSQALAALSPAERSRQIAEAVQAAIVEFERESHLMLPARFRALEARRLEKLLDLWLTLESKRTTDFTVVACEQAAEVEIEGIRVKMIVDRIDQLGDGRQIIIDYKTGASIDIRNWAEQRITEPQLPIYAALVNDEVAAVVFAKVLPDKPAFAGVAEEKDLLPGVQGIGDEKQKLFDPAEFPDWVAVVTHWRERLHAVAREVKTGVAGVAFADPQALRYCEVKALLRLPERARLLARALVETPE